MTLRAIRAKDFTDSGDYLVVDDAQRTVAFIYRDPESHEWYEIPETNRHYTECWLGSTKKDALATLVRHGRDVGGESNRAGRVAKPMDSMTEVLLTVLAISQSGYAGPLSHAIPSRLQSALRRAREAGFVYVDDAGPYLEDEGAVELQRRGFGGSVFSNNRGGESNLTGRRSDANRSDAQVKFGDYDLHYNARPHLNEWDVEAYAPVQASNRAGGDWPVEQCAGCNEDVVLKRPRKGMDRDDYFVLCSACMRKAREHRKKHPKPPLAQTTPVVPTPPVVCPDCRGTGVTITGHRCFCTI